MLLTINIYKKRETEREELKKQNKKIIEISRSIYRKNKLIKKLKKQKNSNKNKKLFKKRMIQQCRHSTSNVKRCEIAKRKERKSDRSLGTIFLIF